MSFVVFELALPKPSLHAGEPAETIDLGLLGHRGVILEGGFVGGVQFPSYPSDLSRAGDVNGDGFDDFFVQTFARSASSWGQLLVLGGPGLETRTMLDGPQEGVSLFTISPEAVSTLHALPGGPAVGIGDVNGDGLGDVLIALSTSDRTTDPIQGKVYLIVGFDKSEGTYQIDIDAGTDGYPGLVLEAPSAYALGDSAFTGRALASLGDFNGDGIADLAISARFAEAEGRTNAGRVYVLFWKPELLARKTLNLDDVGGDLPGFMAYGEGPPPGEEIGDEAGTTVVAAGDVNGDGFADLLVGAPRRGRTDGGFVYLLFGAADYPPRIDLAQLGSRGARLRGPQSFGVPAHSASTSGGGEAAAGVGDVNGDGLPDFLMGFGGDCCSFTRPTVEGRAYLVLGRKVFPPELDLVEEEAQGRPGLVTFHDAEAGDRAGSAVESAGDINGDGIPDFLIGAYWAGRAGVQHAGKAYVVFGGPHLQGSYSLGDVPSRLPGIQVLGVLSNDFVGLVLSGLGDINGDGQADFGVGASYQVRDLPDAHPGRLYLILGGRGRDLFLSQVAPGFGSHLGGYEVALLGSGFTEPGPIHVRFGGLDAETRVVSSSELRVRVPPSEIAGPVDVEVFRGQETTRLAAGFEYTPESQTIDLSGPSPGVLAVRDDGVSTASYAWMLAAGDFDGDGFSDSAFAFEHSEAFRIAVVPGRANLAGVVGVTRIAPELGGHFIEVDNLPAGTSSDTLAGVGDWNGDGYEELAIGTSQATAYLVLGRPTFPEKLSLTRDLQDGRSLRIVLPELSGFPEVSLVPELRVAAAGDLNGDGHPDLAIGVPADSPTGSVYIVLGRGSSPSEIDLSLDDGIVRIAGSDQRYFGREVARAGDFNGDGIGDLVAAAYRSEDLVQDGSVFVIFGSREAAGTRQLADLLQEGEALETIIDFALLNFKSVQIAGGGDLNGDGFADVLVGLKGAGVGFRGEVYAIWGGKEIPPTVDIRDLVLERGAVIAGELGGDYLSAVAIAGDFNSDGIADALLGAPGSQGPFVGAPGKAYVVLGARDFPARLELARLGGRGIRMTGVVGFGGAGYRVSSAGDVDRDGASDILIAENGLIVGDGVRDRPGAAYIVRSAYGAKGFRRGDTNGDDRLDLSDGVSLLGFLFLGQRGTPCADAADADDSGDLNISDAIRILSFLFLSAAPPPLPGPATCGPDPTDDELGCEFYSCL